MTAPARAERDPLDRDYTPDDVAARCVEARELPPSAVYVLSRRPSFRGGPTDATDYGWFVWEDDPDLDLEPIRLGWIR